MTNPNDPAFPCNVNATIGMSKREYFAAMAMKALWDSAPQDGGTTIHKLVPDAMARSAIRLADALIEALNK